MSEANNNNQIIKVQNTSLTKVSSTLSITKKLLNEINSRNSELSNDFRVPIPDLNFQRYLTEKLGIKVKDGNVNYSDVKDVTEIDFDSFIISTLKGIEYFVNLEKLYCRNQQLLKELDITKNFNLKKLDCAWNLLTELNVSKNISLIELDCNYNQLTELDVSKNTNLSILKCSSNYLIELNLTENRALTELWCGDNDFPYFDISNNIALTHLDCESESITDNYFKPIKLTDLDVTKNVALIYLNCNGNELKYLNIKNNKNLKDISYTGNPEIKIEK